MIKKIRVKQEGSSDGGTSASENDDPALAQSSSLVHSRPQEVVDVKDASSVVSGISAPESCGEVEDGLEIPASIAESPGAENDSPAGTATQRKAGAPISFMSPLGKASKKIKRKSIVKKSKKVDSAASLTEINDTEDGKKTPAMGKPGKVKVVKKTKSPVAGAKESIPIKKTDDLHEIKSSSHNVLPGSDHINAEEAVSKSDKKIVKMKQNSSASSTVAGSSTSSTKSNGSTTPVKTMVKKLLSPSLSSHFKKESPGNDTPDATECKSIKSGTKKKKKAKSSSSHSGDEIKDEERSVRSGTKKTNRARSKSRDRGRGNSDEKSVDTTRSRSKRAGRKKADSQLKDSEKESDTSQTAAESLRDENKSLKEETASLREQLSKALESSEIKESNRALQVEVDQLKYDLSKSQQETKDLHQEIADCEESMAEKDGLIKKLTDAVDAQLDKVEHLEMKLQRAEEEFCNMEDEMKEMEEVIESLKVESDGTKATDDKEDECDKHDEHDELLEKFVKMETDNNGLREENQRLVGYVEEWKAKEQLVQEKRDEDIRVIQIGINKQLQELDDENTALRRQIEVLNEEKNTDGEALRQQIEDLRKEKTRLDIMAQRPHDLGQDGLSNGYVFELEVEIADLREKIVEQEDHNRRQKEEIAIVFVENEEIKQDLREREIELRDLESQLSESKAASAKKMQQKDETIAFMQTEMMRIMQEKQKADEYLRKQKLDQTENDLMSSSRHRKGVDEEVEKERLQAINNQLRQLDDENRQLEEKLRETQYSNSMRLKESQGIILDLQEELSDAKWELGARKEGADYITLLKDRKERKRQLDQARKEVKKVEERVSDLERENCELTLCKLDLEKEVESLNKSVVSIDSGDFVAGLKRQIKSLKQHNMALERKTEVDERTGGEKVRLQDAKIKSLEHEIEKLRNPTRAALKGVFYNFARKRNGHDILDDLGQPISAETAENLQEVNDVESEPIICGEERSTDSDPTESLSNNNNCNDDVENNSGDQEKRGGRLWNLFSPRKSTPKVQRSATWESKSTAEDLSTDSDASNEKAALRIEEATFESQESRKAEDDLSGQAKYKTHNKASLVEELHEENHVDAKDEQLDSDKASVEADGTSGVAHDYHKDEECADDIEIQIPKANANGTTDVSGASGPSVGEDSVETLKSESAEHTEGYGAAELKEQSAHEAGKILAPSQAELVTESKNDDTRIDEQQERGERDLDTDDDAMEHIKPAGKSNEHVGPLLDGEEEDSFDGEVETNQESTINS